MTTTSSPYPVYGLDYALAVEKSRGENNDPPHDHGSTESNDHLASIYTDQDEQFATVVPFIRQGLERGERCLYVADDNSKEDVLAALREGGIDVTEAVQSGALSIHTKADTYLRTGEFDRDAMIEDLEESLAQAQNHDGFEGIRAAGEMTWALDSETDLDYLVSYEAALNTAFQGEEYTLLCQYNRNRFPPAVITDVIRTHPLVVHNNTVCPNAYYHPPDEFFGSARPTVADTRTDRPTVTDNRTDRPAVADTTTLAPRTQPESQPPTPNEPLATTSRPVRVLCVGDEPESADRTTLIERHDGIDTVITEPTAREALRRLDDTVDCVVSDHELSDTDGLAFLEAVRETRPELPFISVTDGESEEFVREAIAGGVTDYLRKPDGADQYTSMSHRISKAVRESRTERAKQAHHQYRRLIEESSDVIAVLDEQGRVTYLSPSAERRLGYPAAELVGDSFFEYVHPDDEAAVQDRVAALMDHPEQRVSTEFRFEQRDGSRIWLEARGRNLLDDPAIEGLVMYVRDVTDRKEREQEFEAMGERVDLVLESTDAVLWEWQPDSDTAAAIYPSAASLFGRDIESYEAFATLIHPDDRRRVDDTIEAALESKTSYSFECRIELDGEVRWLGTEGRVVRDEQGDAVRVVGVSTDITERQRREQDLRELTEEYEAVFDNAEDAIFLLDVDHSELGVEFRFERLSPSLEAISGLRTEEIRGKTPREALGDDLGAEVEANYRRCVRAREPITYEEELPLPEDLIIWHTSLAPVIVDGDVTRIVGIARDVTTRKRREARLVGQNDLARACLEADTRQQIADLVVDRAEELLGMPVALVARYDDDSNTLEPAAATSAAESALDIAALLAAEGPGWRTFAENEPRRLTEIADGIAPDSGAVGIWPLGRHGVFVASMDEDGGTIADAFGATVAATMQTALDDVAHLQDLEEREARLTDLTDTLERLNRVNDVIRQVDQALVHASTRSAVEEAVCEELARFEPYECAVMCGYDQLEETVVASEWAGDEKDYLDAVSLDTGPWTVAAETRDPQVVQEFLSDPPLEPWREAALAREFRSCLALPVTYGDSLYGVLTVFGDRQGLFDEMEREVLGELADNIAHAVNAVESKQALVSDRVVELEFETRSEEVPFVALVTETGGRFEFQTVVPQADGRLKAFFTMRGATPDDVRAFLRQTVAVEDCQLVGDRDDALLFACLLTEQSVVSHLVDHGVVPRELTAESGVGRFVVELSATVDIRAFVETLEARYPDVELVGKCTHDRSMRTRQGFRAGLEDRFTDRQLEVLQTAYHSGYFESPRANTGEAVADTLDISQPTFATHIRTAHRKLLDLLFEDS